MKYAGFWRRAAAAVIDGVLINAVFAAIMMGLVLYTIEEIEIGICALVFSWLYFAWMESSKKQATLGKMLVGILVTDISGNRISFGRASGRFFGKFASSLTFMIGYLVAAFTERKQALHDMMTGCLVICKPKLAEDGIPVSAGYENKHHE